MTEIAELTQARLQLDEAEAAFKQLSYELHVLNCETVRPAEKEEARLRMLKIRDLNKKVKAARADLRHKRLRLQFSKRLDSTAQAVTELYGEDAWVKIDTKSKLLAKGRKQEKT